MQTILGGNGTIGSLLAVELLKYTDHIRLVSRNPKKVNEGDELFPADLSQPDQVDRAVAGSEIVYLLVGLEYKIKVWQATWPKIMQATIDACIKHNAKLVFFDNVYLYDANAIGHMTEESPVNPPSKKGAVRKEIVDMLFSAMKNKGLNALIARSADFYGPNNDKSFLTEIVYKNIKKGKRPNWLINDHKKHSFTFTPDAARATALLGNTPAAYGQTWHLPTDKAALTGREMISLFTTEMNVPDKVFVLPMWLLKILGWFMPSMREMPEMMYQYDRDYIFDSSKFDQQFNFSTTSYQQGVHDTIVQTSN